jgi:hypothetical protein
MQTLDGWTISFRCSGANCVQAKVVWSRSAGCSDSACVEVCQDQDEILMRDSKSPDQQPLRFSRAEWDDFLDAIRRGHHL